MKLRNMQQGYVLITVVVTLFILSAIALLLNRESSMSVNMAANELRVATARYAAEAGYNHAFWQANSGSCTGYANPLTANFGANSYTVSVSPTSGSPVSINAAGTLTSGETVNLNRNNLAIYQSPTIALLQPNATVGKDTHIYQWKTTWNFGADPNLVVAEEPPDSNQHLLLQFDLSTIPAEAKILTAKLELHSNVNSWGSTPIDIHRLTSDWTEGSNSGGTGAGANWTETDTGATWSASGGDFDSSIIASAVSPGAVGWMNWDITGLVSDWVSAKAPNYGMLLRTSIAAEGAQFDSSDATDVTRHPKLTITYACECGAGQSNTALIQPGAQGEDTYIADGGNASTNYASSAIIELSSKVNNNDRGLIRFDLTGLPAGAIVNSAILELNLEGVTSLAATTVAVHQVTTEWQAKLATWNTPSGGVAWTTAGGDYAATPVTTVAIDPAVLGATQFNISSLVSSWMTGTPNYGVLLQAGIDANNVRFTSSNSLLPALRPKLTLQLSCPCGVVCDYVPPVTSCSADFQADTKINEFDTALYGSGTQKDLDYLPEGVTFNGVLVPNGGAWLSVDRDDNLFYLNDMSGALLTTLPGSSSMDGVAYVKTGIHAGQVATIDFGSDDVRYYNMDGTAAGSFSLTGLAVDTPSGTTFIETTTSGIYDNHLAITDRSQSLVYITDQAGILKVTLDLSTYAAGGPSDVAHIPGSDKLLVLDVDQKAFIVAFDGSKTGEYDLSAFGANSTVGLAINPLTCDHVIGDEGVDKVISLNTSGGGVSDITLNTDRDSQIDQFDPTINNGLANQMIVSVANNKHKRPVLHFDASSMPSGTLLTTATLRLWVRDNRSTNDATLSIFKLTEDWTENEVSWDNRSATSPWTNAGGTFSGTPIDSKILPGGVKLVWMEWDITTLVQEWVDFPASNHGLIIQSDQVKDVKFSSKEAVDPADFPQLLIIQ